MKKITLPILLIALLLTACGANARPSGPEAYPYVDSGLPAITGPGGAVVQPPGAESVDFEILPYCNGNGSYDFRASWSPIEYSIYRVDDPGVGIINCGLTEGGSVTCYNLAPHADGQLYMTFVHRNTDIDEVMHEFVMAAPGCLTGVESGDVTNDSDFGWLLRNVGCLPTGRIEFNVITPLAEMEWIGACFTTSECRGMTNVYDCEPSPSRPGWIYCTGPRPTAGSFLRFCLQMPFSMGTNCQNFPDFVSAVDSCVEVGPDAPDPMLVMPVPFSCSSTYGIDSTACKNDYLRCTFDFANMVCVNR